MVSSLCISLFSNASADETPHTGPEPHRALHLLEALQLFGTTFMEPLELPLRQLKPGTTNAFTAQLSSEAEPASSRVALRASRILDALWRSEACGGPSRSSHAGEEAGIPPLPPSPLPAGLVEAVPVELLAPLREEGQRRRLFLAAALLPLRGLAANDKGNKWCWSGEHIIANGLKVSGLAELSSRVRHADRLFRHSSERQTREIQKRRLRALSTCSKRPRWTALSLRTPSIEASGSRR